jgi:hypothetical protein
LVVVSTVESSGVKRFTLWTFGVLALVGTAVAVLYAVHVAPGATTSFDAAILVFTAAAAITGYLGILIGWLSYRLEAGKVPKPDLAIVAEGQLLKEWLVEIDLLPLDAEVDVSEDLATERSRLDEIERRLRRPPSGDVSAVMAAFIAKPVTEEAIEKFSKEAERYLVEFEKFLRGRYVLGAFWARSKRLIFAFTNERAGVPAEGVRVLIHVPTGSDLKLLESTEVPDSVEPPRPPTPPRPQSILDAYRVPSIAQSMIPSMNQSLGKLGTVRPQGNVSPPTIRKGSTVVEFSVSEVLHNLYEDSREDPLVLMFNSAGSWDVPYEIHARNLPQPVKGTLKLKAQSAETKK